tara:strand:+ start:1111 stop:1818 length:708 start_codon:yes stop_codon:yes gene_type:complete
MSKYFKIPFAYDQDQNVVDVLSAERGKTYKCSCGSDVKLRGGHIVSDHFYHITESKCSLESAIHKAYKSVFQKNKKIRLPFEINGSKYIEFDRVELEKKIDDYIPDAIGYVDDTMYLIEFAKTSYIGERKKKKIKKTNVLCIEVSIIKTVKSIHEIEKHITTDNFYKKLIHIPEYHEAKDLREKFKKAYHDLENKHRQKCFDLEKKHNQNISWYKHQIELLKSTIKQMSKSIENF